MEDLKLDLEIYDIWYEPIWYSKYFFLFCSIISILCLIFCIKFLISKLPKKEVSVSDLIKQLNLLSNQIGTSNDSVVYSELILIIKKFIAINYKKDLLCKTEKELIYFLELQEVPENLVEEFKDIMTNAQEVKFSKSTLLKIQLEKNIRKSIELIVILNDISNTKANNKTT